MLRHGSPPGAGRLPVVKYPNRYPGHCRYCACYVGTGSGLIERVNGAWLVEHAGCKERQALATADKAPRTARKARQAKGPAGPSRWSFGEELGIFEPLQVTRDPVEIRYHLLRLESLAAEFKGEY
jgi:hypothetical protein